MQEKELEQIAIELDEIHARSKKAFLENDLDAYMSTFSLTLSYKQANGKIINWEQLRNDVAPQLSSAHNMESTYVREQIEMKDSKIVEVLSQTATYEIKVFLFFKRKWIIRRKGRYTWSKNKNNWQIKNVEVLNEKIL
ncbi:MAG: hypothetical protein GY714_21760 [Desulfobacterales bacterium]|nr:hypothetical protein [Desulfobacterales bacterium]